MEGEKIFKHSNAFRSWGNRGREINLKAADMLAQEHWTHALSYKIRPKRMQVS